MIEEASLGVELVRRPSMRSLYFGIPFRSSARYVVPAAPSDVTGLGIVL